MDRISGLPQAIIHDHIFPFLPNKDIKLTTSLSKTWYHLSNSFPYLDFSNHGFRFVFREIQCKEPEEEEQDKYLNYVGQTLQRFHEHSDGLQIIKKLSIPLVFRPRVAPLLDSWIQLVLQHGVEVFNLDITNSQGKNLYGLPRAVFNANSMIKVASIKGCSLLHVNYVNDTNLIMRKLHLERVLLGETTLSSIISGCPLIEELSIKSCMGMVNCLRIFNLRKLKSLVIFNWGSMRISDDDATNIVIDAPSLQNLEIQWLFPKMRILGQCPILTDLKLMHIVDELELQDILPRLPFLRRLSLVNIYKLTKLKVSSDSLNKLTVLECQNLVELQIDAPNLLNVVYKGDFAPLRAYSLTHDHTNVTSAQWYVTTGPNGLVPPVEFFLAEVSNFVSKMKHIECLDLKFEEAKYNLNFEELIRGVDQSPAVAKIDKLRLSVARARDLIFESMYASNHFFDTVLWICRPRSLHLELKSCYRDLVVKRIREIIMGDWRRYKLGRRCWLHCLEDVMFVTKDGTENLLSREEGTFVPLCSQIKFIFNWAVPRQWGPIHLQFR